MTKKMWMLFHDENDDLTYTQDFFITLDENNYLAPTDCKPTGKLLCSKDGVNFKPCKTSRGKRNAILDELELGAITIYTQKAINKAEQEGAELKPFGYND